MNRRNIYFSEEQHRRLKAAAAARGCSMSEIVRQAIELYLDEADRRAGKLYDVELGFVLGMLFAQKKRFS